MTIIFGGIDFPIFELLFIVSILLLCGLFIMILGIYYILNELRDLKGILHKEEDTVKEFEKDVSELEKFEGRGKGDLKGYIDDSIAKGYKWEQIKEALIKQGWNDKELEKFHKV